jgi:hypothetical protein
VSLLLENGQRLRVAVTLLDTQQSTTAPQAAKRVESGTDHFASMSKYFKWAELPPRKDIYTYEGTTRWGNHDLYPIPKKERTYGYLGLYSYLLVSGISITGFSMGSADVSAGLSAQETIGALLVGCICAALNARQVGLDKSLGFVSDSSFLLFTFFPHDGRN